MRQKLSRHRLAVASVFALALATACGPKKPEIIVGQTGLAVAKTIGQLQTATQQLTAPAGPIPVLVSLGIQEKLLALNGKVSALPELVRTMDRLVKAGQSATDPADRAIAILKVAGQDLSVVFAGVPLGPTTQTLIDLIRASQQTITTTLLEVAKIKAGAQ